MNSYGLEHLKYKYWIKLEKHRLAIYISKKDILDQKPSDGKKKTMGSAALKLSW
jgi:hypothetical protein